MSADIIEYSSNIALDVGKRLLKGEIGIFPCDTIYGVCSIVSEQNANRIYEIKERPKNKSFITLMTKEQVLASKLIIPEDIISFWPASLTAIVNSEEGSTIAVRVPSDCFLQSVMNVSGPIYSTSVNLSGHPSLQNVEEIIMEFKDKVDFIVKKTNLIPGLPSTLVDTTTLPYKILRQGEFILPN